MAIVLIPGQVAVGDPSPTGPTPLSNVKDVLTKVIKLSSANFTTGGVNTLVAVFPADSTLLSVDYYTKTALSGNGVTLPTVSLGSTSGGTQFTTTTALTNTTGTHARVSGVSGFVQNYSLPLGTDINLYVAGACSTGNPTAGEIYLIVNYVR
jgi:hypothetical protein